MRRTQRTIDSIKELRHYCKTSTTPCHSYQNQSSDVQYHKIGAVTGGAFPRLPASEVRDYLGAGGSKSGGQYP